MKDSRSEHTGHTLNARLLRFRSQPGSEDAHALAEDLIAAKRYGDARGVAVSAQPKDQERGELLILEGRAWLAEQDLVRAQAVLLRAVRASPQLPDAYRWLGQVLLKRGDPQRALKTLQRALALDPNDPETAKLAARAEYLADAANDSVAPAGTAAAPAAPAADGDAVAAARADSLAPDTRPERRVSASPRARDAAMAGPLSTPLPPHLLRTRAARETDPIVDPKDDRLEFGEQSAASTHTAGAKRGGPKVEEEPTSEFRRVPVRDAAGRLVADADHPQLAAGKSTKGARPGTGSLGVPLPGGAEPAGNEGEEAETRPLSPAAAQASRAFDPPTARAGKKASVRAAGQAGGSPAGQDAGQATGSPAGQAGGSPAGQAAGKDASARTTGTDAGSHATGAPSSDRSSAGAVAAPRGGLPRGALGGTAATSAAQVAADATRPARGLPAGMGSSARPAPQPTAADENGRPRKIKADEVPPWLVPPSAAAGRASLTPPAGAETRARALAPSPRPAPPASPPAGAGPKVAQPRAAATSAFGRSETESMRAAGRPAAVPNAAQIAFRQAAGRNPSLPGPPPPSAKDAVPPPAVDAKPGGALPSLSPKQTATASPASAKLDPPVPATSAKLATPAPAKRATPAPAASAKSATPASAKWATPAPAASAKVATPASAKWATPAPDETSPALDLSDHPVALESEPPAGDHPLALESEPPESHAPSDHPVALESDRSPDADVPSLRGRVADMLAGDRGFKGPSERSLRSEPPSLRARAAQMLAKDRGRRGSLEPAPVTDPLLDPTSEVSDLVTPEPVELSTSPLRTARADTSFEKNRLSSKTFETADPDASGADEPEDLVSNEDSAPPENSTVSVENAPDVVLGAEFGRPAEADRTFELVRRMGLFEESEGPAAAWSTKQDVEPSGSRLRNSLIAIWVVSLVLCGGGYFGWQAFVARRHAKAAELVEQARALMKRADHGALVDAERMLRLAREQHPASTTVPREALILQVQRVLEDGERDLAALRSALLRANAAGEKEGAPLMLARSVLAGFSGEAAGRDKALAELLVAAQADPRFLYLAGRIEQRTGKPDALGHLQAAAKGDAKLVPVQLALGEFALDAGDREAALHDIDSALAIDPEHLRARLFRLFLRANDAEAASVQKSLDELGKAMEKAGTIDRALAALVRARVLRRQSQADAASKAVEEAAGSGVDEPRLLGLIAREALALGKLTLAQHIASQALSAAPDVAQNRRLLARILIDRNDGEHALTLLDKLPPDDVEAQIMKAQAALLSSDEPALQAGLAGLSAVQSSKPELASQIGALRIRLESKLTPGRAVVDRARALVRSAPGDPEALLALAEASLAAHDPVTAQNALKQRFAVAPDDPNAHYLSGRARRMAADATGAEASFRRALELSPGHADALIALAGTLLDQGKYADADAVYQELATRGGSSTQGRLGRVEALIGLLRLDDAQVQLDALPEAQQTSVAFRLSAARLALARGKPGDALTLLRPLVDAQSDKVQVMAVYGDALLAAEQLEAAGNAYAAALAIDSELPEALLGRAEVQLRDDKFKEALATLQLAKDTLPKRIRPPSLQARRLILLGRAYAIRNKRGDQDAARDALREALKFPGAPADGFFWLAETLGGKNNPEARANYQRYLELEPHGRYQERAKRASQ